MLTLEVSSPRQALLVIWKIILRKIVRTYLELEMGRKQQSLELEGSHNLHIGPSGIESLDNTLDL